MEDALVSTLEVRASSLSAAALLHTAAKATPDLRRYAPNSSSEKEIMLFNLCGLYKSNQLEEKETVLAAAAATAAEEEEDTVVLWLLETGDHGGSCLSRASVGHFLSLPSSANILTKLAVKVTSLPQAACFSDGLKMFLPAAGATDLYLLSLAQREETKAHQQQAEALPFAPLLTAFAKAHLAHCRSPLITAGEATHVKLAAIARACLALTTTTAAAATSDTALFTSSSSSMMQQQQQQQLSSFIAAVQSFLPSARAAQDLFAEMNAGRPLCPLPISPSTPSYFFSESICAGWLAVSGSYEQERTTFWAILTSDALYLFSNRDHASSSLQNIRHCVPLEKKRMRVCMSSALCLPLIELWPISCGSSLAMLTYNPASFTVAAVEQCQCVVLEVVAVGQGAAAVSVSSSTSLREDEWLDAIDKILLQ